MPFKTCIPPLLKVLVVLGFGGIFCVIEKSRNQWEFLVYTQIWPETQCLLINETHGSGKCIMPKVVKGWTIHGLWPSVASGRDPSYCNDSWPFRPNELKDMWTRLEAHWPNLIVDEATDSLWKHEWLKHGTCGVSLAALQSEHLYFEKSLDLQSKYSLGRMLESSGILPSKDKIYQLDEIRKAIQSTTGHQAQLKCMEADKNTQLLAQVEICLNKEFEVIDCKTSSIANMRHRGRRMRRRPFSPKPKWDWYPTYPLFENCLEHISVKYPPLPQLN